MAALRLKDASRTQLQRAQRLHRREQRARRGQTLVEGPQAVLEALVHAPGSVRDLYATRRAMERRQDVAAAAAEAAVWTHVLDEETMWDLSGDGQGLVAVAEVPANPEPREALTGARLAVATLDVSDPGNLGTIVRTADAAGAGAVLIGRGSVELYAPKVIRAAAGSHFHLPCARGVEPEEIVAAAHAAGMQVLAADGAGEWDLPVLVNAAHEARILGVPPECPDLRDPVLWILGNEARGFAGRRIEGIDARVAIPIYGRAESLNVSMACAVTAYLTALS